MSVPCCSPHYWILFERKVPTRGEQPAPQPRFGTRDSVSGRASRASRGCAGVPSRTLCLPRAAALPPAHGRSSRRDSWRWKGRRAFSWCWASSRPASPALRRRDTPSARPPRRTSVAARTARNPHRESRRPAPLVSSPFCCRASPNTRVRFNHSYSFRADPAIATF
jgi:hypothetical protein